MASDTFHPPSRLDPRSTACTQRTTDLRTPHTINVTHERELLKKIEQNESQPEYTVHKCQPNSQKNSRRCTDSIESKITKKKLNKNETQPEYTAHETKPNSRKKLRRLHRFN